MKILAIRGKNLASLSSEFCVDFTAEPLASAGLYAITGVTGSGKSTLLDALCLALYERTPRLSRAAAQGESIPDVGEHSVGPADPRTILRRGAADGFAEVDFLACDSERYRARWSVRRAREKAAGRLQNSQVTLTRLSDTQPLGDHRKSETLALIETLVGLSFAQFTRAVLLAQNDFATFLKASDDERAELLQTLTGTETFTRISVQAFARQRVENDALRMLETQLAGETPMAVEARTAKAGELATHEARVKALEEQNTRLEAHLRWHAQADQLAASEAEAGAKLDVAKLAREQAGERFAQFARIEAVQPARALSAELARITGEIDGGEKALTAQQASLEGAARRVVAAKEALAVATRELQAAEAAKQAAQPGVDQAKVLDAQMAALGPNHQRAEKARDEAQRVLTQAEARHAALHRELAQAQTAMQSAQRWLAEHAALRPLAEGWPRWETLLAQAAALFGEKRSCAAQCQEFAGQEVASRKTLAQAQAAHSERLAEHKAAAERLAELSQAFAAFEPEEIARRKESAETRRDQLASASALCKELIAQQQSRQRVQIQLDEGAAALAVSDKEIAQCASERPLAERELASSEKMLRVAELAASERVEQLRAGLEADQPCPVCGALAHPYAEPDARLADVLHGLQAEVGRARQRLTELVQRASSAAAHRDATLKRHAALAADVAEVSAAHERSAARWAAHPLVDELIGCTVDARAARLAEAQRAVGETLAELAKSEAACRAALRARDAAQDALTKAQDALAAARNALAARELDAQTIVQAGQGARRKLAETGERLAAVQAGLDAAFADATAPAAWRERWSADPAAFMATCQAEVQAWTTQQGQLSALAEKTGTLTTTIHGALDALTQAGIHLKAQREGSDRLARELLAMHAERKSRFAGRPIGEVEAALARAIDAAKTTLDQRQAGSQQAELERSRLDEALRQGVVRLEAQKRALAAARQAIGEWLARFNAGHGERGELDLDALGELLAFSPAWIDDERRALHVLDGAIANALAVLGEHQKARAAHLAAKPTAEPADALRVTLARTLADLEPAKALATELRVELARDDERRQRSQALLAERDTQAASARVWSQLSELIGSADGKKFRNFAQQLTLDILIGYANRHLETLSRRYRLERISASLGLLVVDQDMGDEVRSVHSLSGGESFLVSLALALGLASLSSHRVQVESLFIDEGFGSLDADSLAVAIAALDSLQAQGRKVGVISHVQEMNERIGTRVEVKRLAGGHSRVVTGG